MSSQGDGAEISKVLGSIYGSMVILAAVLMFLSITFGTLTLDIQNRAFTLFWLVGAMMAVTGAELARNLYKSGMSFFTFIIFLIVNLFLALFLMVVFADMLSTEAANTAIGMVLVYLVAVAAYYLILVLWTLREWRSK
ncbi:MAG: hypothetical protein ACFFAD_15885 [Candidatus Hermodarchaeota archaeon]